MGPARRVIWAQAAKFWVKLHFCRDNKGWFTPLPNQPKLHHFLPEAYLRRFADECGDLWVLDRKEDRPAAVARSLGGGGARAVHP